MDFTITIDDQDLEFLVKQMVRTDILGKVLETNSFTLNRWDDAAAACVRRLRTLGILDQRPYYGEAMCYNPEYELTDLGKRVMEKVRQPKETT